MIHCFAVSLRGRAWRGWRGNLRTPRQFGQVGVIVEQSRIHSYEQPRVENADEVKVGLNVGRELPAKIWETDRKVTSRF